MAHDIRIISVELNNYRQFYGKQTVEFSSREEGFTTLIGENGEGKSNLLNAINWCFYKFEPHGKKLITPLVEFDLLQCCNRLLFHENLIRL